VPFPALLSKLSEYVFLGSDWKLMGVPQAHLTAFRLFKHYHVQSIIKYYRIQQFISFRHDSSQRCLKEHKTQGNLYGEVHCISSAVCLPIACWEAVTFFFLSFFFFFIPWQFIIFTYGDVLSASLRFRSMRDCKFIASYIACRWPWNIFGFHITCYKDFSVNLLVWKCFSWPLCCYL
jgi:hypothetical protein